MKKIKVLVVDDHPAFREGLSRILADEDDIEVIAQSGDGKEAIELGARLCPDVVIVDVAMPGINGIEVAKQIKKACPSTATLMVSAYNYESYVFAALQAGAAGYVLKDAPVKRLIDAIRMVSAGEAVLDMRSATAIVRRMTGNNSQQRVGVTPLHEREQQVLELAAKGLGNKEIAERLTISERTVQTHLINIFRKLGVGSRTEAVIRALKTGWLALDDLS